jgi:23S rRNA (guanosine2251-2'-O)-methyltransferase
MSKDTNKADSENYQKKKQFFDQLLTIYGRNPVLEALQDKNNQVYRLHLADSNRQAKVIDDIIKLAQKRDAQIVYHSRQELSRISKNAKQDQGVAVDLVCQGYQDYKTFLQNNQGRELDIIALDRITNPQNLGMIIRSVCAGAIDGLLLPRKGCAKLDPLVIKASAGTLFRAPILRCDALTDALQDFQQHNFRIYGLSSHADTTIGSIPQQGSSVFVLGNETEGVSQAVANCCDHQVSIPMRNQVESLNVAVTASLLAFRKVMI